MCELTRSSKEKIQRAQSAPASRLSLDPVPHGHTHPLGQILIVTAGCGLAQHWDGPVEEILPGDVVWIPPGEKHWHGARETTAMIHIAIQEQLDGKTVDWMEKVSDEQYHGGRQDNKRYG